MPGREIQESRWHRLLAARVSRRDAIKKGLLAGGVGVLPIELQANEPSSVPTPAEPSSSATTDWRSISPSADDALKLPDGYNYNVVVAYDDPIALDQAFGYNNDHIAYLPIDLLEGGRSSDDGLLVVNHEYPHLVLQHRVKKDAIKDPRCPEQIRLERTSLGVSVVRVRCENGEWSVVKDDHNRRITGYTPCEMTGPVRGAGVVGGRTEVAGSVGNCSGGVTPWGTVLSCEENVDEYADKVADKGYGWGDDYDPPHYGWVVEVDPFDPHSIPKKRTALGRFRHENVAVFVRPDGRVVAYMGDDKRDACIYKFVTKNAIHPTDRAQNMNLLDEGRLYAADFAKGRWVALDPAAPALKSAKFKDDRDNERPRFPTLADVLYDARAAALALGATPVDRPEDIEIHPKTHEVFVALTNNDSHGNFHGQIVSLRESESDETQFDWDFFATGGPSGGFSSPDNLIFDPKGNLWMVTDVSSSKLSQPALPPDADEAAKKAHTARSAANRIHRFQGNNAMFCSEPKARTPARLGSSLPAPSNAK